LNLNFIKNILLAVVLMCLTSCSAPQIPPEAKQAEEQDLALWRAGAPLYLPEEYERYKKALIRAQIDLIHLNTSSFMFRNYTSVQSEFRELLKAGDVLIGQLELKKQEFSQSVENKMSFFQNQIEMLKGLSRTMNEGRLARSDIIKAEVILLEVKKRYEKNDFIGADEKMPSLGAYLNAAEKILFPIAKRYSDKIQIMKWQHWVDDTVAESKTKNIPVMVVNKSNRTLTLYKRGNAFKTYTIGLGRNGSKDKLHAGDYATPEGRYKIIKKLPRSRYHKALLINYPNEDDKRQFKISRKKGLIPRQVGIGGLIEIHGGGKDSMTFGCIALDNPNIDELYSLVDVGTPITIVGAVDSKNSYTSAIQGK
jgi:murein L,D-transpeptidase YafK